VIEDTANVHADEYEVGFQSHEWTARQITVWVFNRRLIEVEVAPLDQYTNNLV